MAKLTIKYDDNDFFRKYLEILSPLLKVTRKERIILAEIMKRDYSCRYIDIKDRYIIILSTESRKKMCTDLEISEWVFNNALVSFRKHNYLIRNKENIEQLAPYLIVDPDKVDSIVFNFEKTTKDE